MYLKIDFCTCNLPENESLNCGDESVVSPKSDGLGLMGKELHEQELIFINSEFDENSSKQLYYAKFNKILNNLPSDKTLKILYLLSSLGIFKFNFVYKKLFTIDRVLLKNSAVWQPQSFKICSHRICMI